MPKHAYHEGMLPDHVVDLMKCSFWSDNGKMTPIVHLLSKSTPQRCQIRSLTMIMLNYCKVHDNVFEFVLNALKCSMLGAYRGTKRPPLRIRKRIYKVFSEMTRRRFLVFMQNRHQQLLFFTIKEYLIFCAHMPALREELKIRYKWEAFEKRVTDTMDVVRDYARRGQHYGVYRCGEVPDVLSIGSNRICTDLASTFCRVLMHECEHHDDLLGLASGRHEHFDLMYQMLIRVPLGQMPLAWLELFNVSRGTISQLIGFQRRTIRLDLEALSARLWGSWSEYEFETVRALARAYDRKINVRMFTLPAHSQGQIQALRQMHNVPDGEELHHTIGTTHSLHGVSAVQGGLWRTARQRRCITYMPMVSRACS